MRRAMEASVEGIAKAILKGDAQASRAWRAANVVTRAMEAAVRGSRTAHSIRAIRQVATQVRGRRAGRIPLLAMVAWGMLLATDWATAGGAAEEWPAASAHNKRRRGDGDDVQSRYETTGGGGGMSRAAAPTREVGVGPDAPMEAEEMEAEGAEGEMAKLTVAFWNARSMGAVKKQGEAQGGGETAREKMDWLIGWAAREHIDALLVCEVNGSRRNNQAMRRRFRKEGYEMRMMTEHDGSHRNGMLVAMRRETLTLEAALRVAPRTYGVVARSMLDNKPYSLVGIHGLQSDARYITQVEAAEAWMESRGGGVVIGDHNHVACRRWRAKVKALGAADKRARQLTGGVCTCCAGRDDEAVRWVRPRGVALPFTRAATRDGEWNKETAYIDYAVATGCEAGAWRAKEHVPAETTEGRSLSDHVAVVIERDVGRAGRAGFRPKSVLRQGSKLQQKELAEELRVKFKQMDFKMEVTRAVKDAEASGLPRSSAMTKAVVDTAIREADTLEERKKEEAEGGRRVKAWRRNDERQQWTWRRREAVRMRDAGADVWGREAHGLFHHKVSELREVRMWHAQATNAQAWEAVVSRCRRRERIAHRKAAERHKQRVAARMEELTAAERMEGDAMARLAAVWRALSESRASAAMHAAYVGDDKGAGERITHRDARFKRTMRDIGRRFVERLDKGAVPKAFKAWCAVFMGDGYSTLRQTNGEPWSIRSAFT